MKYFIAAACFSFLFSFAQAPELIVPAGHGDQVYLTKFSADGKFLFSGHRRKGGEDLGYKKRAFVEESSREQFSNEPATNC